MERQARVASRNRKAFPNYRPVHEIYVEFCQAKTRDGSLILHLGAGRDSHEICGRLGSRRLVSVDKDKLGISLNQNPRRIVADAGALPFHAEVFDMVMAENVFEHLVAPSSMLLECHRLLHKGGRIVFMCPNRNSYIALLSRLTPYRLHIMVRRFCEGQTADIDTFPTYYRLNTPRAIHRMATAAGFVVEHLESFVGWAGLWEFSDLLHRFLTVIHQTLERYRILRPFHITLFGVLRKSEVEVNQVDV